jgi:predicted tellurium resistance membrane protein TerC
MFDWISTLNGWASLGTLTAMEIILSIDNIIFMSVIVARLPKEAAKRALLIGLLMALAFRILLLLGITAIIALQEPLFSMFGHGWSWRDIILFAGGAFLIAKAVHEMHMQIEGPEHPENEQVKARNFTSAIIQIAIVNIVFSIDSIVTAIGMANDIAVMVISVVIAMLVMYVASGPIAAFVDRHPTTKTLALAFLVLIGFSLCAEATGVEVSKGYVYAAMAFAALVEAINLWTVKDRKQKPRKPNRPPELARKD